MGDVHYYQFNSMLQLLLLLLLLISPCVIVQSQPFSDIVEPYPELNSGSFSGPPVSDSFDPLIQYRWEDNGMFK